MKGMVIACLLGSVMGLSGNAFAEEGERDRDREGFFDAVPDDTTGTYPVRDPWHQDGPALYSDDEADSDFSYLRQSRDRVRARDR